MKFLCLHGGGTNPDTFRMQLLPLIQDLESDGTASFHFARGAMVRRLNRDALHMLGGEPHLFFFGPVNTELLDPGAGSQAQDKSQIELQVADALEDLYNTMEKDGPFQGVIGFSQGATLAATLVCHDAQRRAALGQPASFRCGVFMSGAAPLAGFTRPADEASISSHKTMINLPTCHVIGSCDLALQDNLQLFAICDQATATIVDHGKGHVIPVDTVSSELICRGVRELIQRADRN